MPVTPKDMDNATLTTLAGFLTYHPARSSSRHDVEKCELRHHLCHCQRPNCILLSSGSNLVGPTLPKRPLLFGIGEFFMIVERDATFGRDPGSRVRHVEEW